MFGERERRQAKGRGGWVLELEEQQRQAGAAMLLSQASTPLPGYPLAQTPLESLELQVSSGLFRRGHIFILVHQGSVKKKWRLSMRDLR